MADELPDEVIELMRQAVKKESADNVLLGEVWEDATIKESYGRKRTYALGKGLDSVMNYPFRNMTIAWLTGWQQSREIANFLNTQKANYPQPMYGALMNLVSSHDVSRIRTVLAAGTEGKGMSREDQAGYVLDHKSERKGAKLSRLAMGLQFMIPGVPSVYYGDEYGMTGFSDPFNRGTLEKKDVDSADFVKRLSLLRKKEPTLRTGGMSVMSLGERGLAVLRCMEDGTEQGSCILAVFNPTRMEQEFQIPLSELKEGLNREERKIVENRWKTENPGRIEILFTAEIKGETEGTCQFQDELTVCLGPTDMVVLRL